MNSLFATADFPQAKAKFEVIPDTVKDQYEQNIEDGKRSSGKEEDFYRAFRELNDKIKFPAPKEYDKNGRPVYENPDSNNFSPAYYYADLLYRK